MLYHVSIDSVTYIQVNASKATEAKIIFIKTFKIPERMYDEIKILKGVSVR